MSGVPLSMVNEHSYFLVLVDFDHQANRRIEVQELTAGLPADRTFILGAWSEPERLRESLGLRFERIGETFAQECATDSLATWNHPLLAHNLTELQRLRNSVRPILFMPQ